MPMQTSCPLPQAGFTASYSDDLFRPVHDNFTPRTFVLPDVPLNPNPQYCAYNCQMNVPCPLPTISSSYNNPTFAIPPLYKNNPRTSLSPYNNVPTNSLGQALPVPPCFSIPPTYHQPYYPAYNAFPLNQMAYPLPAHVATLYFVVTSFSCFQNFT